MEQRDYYPVFIEPAQSRPTSTTNNTAPPAPPPPPPPIAITIPATQALEDAEFSRYMNGAFGLPATSSRTTVLPLRGVTRFFRDIPPADYTLKIDSFSVLSAIYQEHGIESYESNTFEAGGYKWRLSLFPNGNPGNNGEGYISFYLVLEDASNFPSNLVVEANFKLFLYNHIRHHYLTIQNIEGQLSRFHKSNYEYGFPRFISLSAFKDPCKGYLVNDSCIFGAEIFVVRSKNRGEHLTLLKEPASTSHFHTRRIDKFSKIRNAAYSSEIVAGGRKWKLGVYPESEGDVGLHLYLLPESFKFKLIPNYVWRWLRGDNERKIYIQCLLSLKDQMNDEKNITKELNGWFSPTDTSLGYPGFVSMEVVKDESNGFLVNDSIIVEIEFESLFADVNFT